MGAKTSMDISLLIRFLLLLQAHGPAWDCIWVGWCQDVLCREQTKPKACMNNEMYVTNQFKMQMSHNEAMAFCLSKGYRIATMDSNDTGSFERIIINCDLPFSDARYWISDTTTSTICWKLNISSSVNRTVASVRVQPEGCGVKLNYVLCEVPSNLTSSSTISSPKASSTPAPMLKTASLSPSFTTDNQLSVSTSSMASWTDLQHSTYSYQTPFTIAGTSSNQYNFVPGESELSSKVSLWSVTTGALDGISSTKSSLDLEQSTTADISKTIISSVTEKPASSASITDSHKVTATSPTALDTQTPTTKTGLSPDNTLSSVEKACVSPMSIFRRMATNTGYNSTAIASTYATSSPTCAYACRTRHVCVLYTFNMATGCRMYNDSDFSLLYEEQNTDLWVLQHSHYCKG